MFKKIILDGKETIWSVSEDGEVINDLTGYSLKGTILSGYRYVNLRHGEIQKNKAIHRLVAETFLPNPENLPVVHHKDGNRFNNCVSNLEWVTSQYNRQQALPPKHDPDRIVPEGGDDERWEYFRNSFYQVSNYGRVKNTRTNRILRGSYGADNYYRVDIKIPGEKKRKYLVHRLVWEAFNNIEPRIINHIDGNKQNNRLENLENVSHRENMIKAAYETNAWNFRKVAQYDRENNYIRTFANATEAANSIGILPGSLRNTIRRNGFTRSGYKFVYLQEEPSSTSV